MKLLLLVPTAVEMEAFKNTAPKVHTARLCGLGPAEAAFNATRFIKNAKPEAVILAGIAGAYKGAGLYPGDIAIATAEVFGDLGRCTEKGIEPIVLKNKKLSFVFSLDSPWHKRLWAMILAYYPVTLGPFVTVSCVSGTSQRARELKERFSACAENMEGAAIARICAHYKIPFLEIRGISNMVSHLDTAKWETEKALANAALVTHYVVTTMQKKDF